MWQDHNTQNAAYKSKIDPLDYWAKDGHQFPRLQQLVLIILPTPISGAASERNWSSADVLSGKRRAQVNADTLEHGLMLAKNTPTQAKILDVPLFDAMKKAP